MSTLKLVSEPKKTSQVDLERNLTQISTVMQEAKVTIESWRGSDTMALWDIDEFKVKRRMAKTQVKQQDQGSTRKKEELTLI